MSDTLWTRGPWQWAEVSDGWDGKTVELQDADGKQLLCGWGYDASGIAFASKGDETEYEASQRLPDARLIARAPEMAELLNDIACSREHVMDHEPYGAPPCRVCSLLADIKGERVSTEP